MQVRPYVLSATSQLKVIKEYISNTLLSWSDEWGLESNQVNFQNVYAWSESERQNDINSDLVLSVANGSWVFCSVDEDLYKILGTTLIGGGGNFSVRHHSIVFDIVNDAIRDLAAKIFQSTAEQILGNEKEDCLNGIEFARMNSIGSGSGAVCVSFISEGRSFCFRFLQQSLPIDLEVVARLGVQGVDNKEFVSIKDSISCQRVKGKVILGASRVDVEALSSLQVGDVIYLDKSLDEPLSVKFGTSDVACKGFLGKKEKNFVIQIDSLVEN